jgi:hypothetical protein
MKPTRPRPLPRLGHRIGAPTLESPIARGPTWLAFPHRSAGARPFEAVEVTVRHPVGVIRRIAPASQLGVREARGTGRVMVDLSRLPAGPLEITLTPWRQGSAAGEPASLRFEVPCASPAPPEPIRLTPFARRVTRPPGADTVFARVRVMTSGRRAGALFVTVTGPDGTAETLDLAPPADGAELDLFAFGSGHRLGKYRISAVAVSADGAIGPATETAFDLVTGKRPTGPRVDSVSSRRDRVVIRGAGFAGPLAVTIGGLPAPLLGVKPGEIAVLPPEDLDQPGEVIVRSVEGTARARTPWVPPARVTVLPDRFTLAEGETIQLTAVIRGSGGRKPTWSIKPASASRVDRNGRVTAAFTGRQTEVTVMARVGKGPGAVGVARGTVTPLTRARPRAMLGRLGGSVVSVDGGSRLEVAPRSLARPSRVAVNMVAPRIRRRAGRGKEPLVAAEARLEPAGAKLARAARLDLALAIPLDPGSRVPVEVQRRRGGRWEVFDQPGTVGVDGGTVRVDIKEIPFGVRVAIGVLWEHLTPRNLSIVAPLIHSIGPNTLDEGATAAILVTGANFVPGLTSVDFLRPNGVVENRIHKRSIAITADGTKLGLALKVDVMEDLGEGQTAILGLRVGTPAGTETAPISIRGHDELDVQPGTTRTVSQSGVFSRMSVPPDGRLNVVNAFPPVTIDCFERAYIQSKFADGGGVVVTPGHGAGGAFGDAGGMGGIGGFGAGVPALGAGGRGGAGGTGDTVGLAGSAGRPSATLTRAGAGGSGGAAGGGGPFPHSGGDGGNGTAGIRTTFVPGLVDFDFEPSPGGGGGGGGGGEGWVFKSTGGGGGGGGAGGGALRIAAGEEITLQGDVVAAGGNGAFGSYPYTVTSRPSMASLIQAGGGGGGGGGAGGMIILQGVEWWSGTVVAVGGINGRAPGYGPAPVEARTGWQILLAQAATGAIRVDGEMPSTRGGAFPGPDLDYVYNLLATAAEVDVRAPAADVIRVTGGQMQTAGFDTETDPALGGRTRITLFEGFNDVRSEWTTAGQFGPPLLSCATFRRRTFLFLPGTIPFYEFDCVVAPATATVPTERRLQLSATVTARPTTRLTWDLWGGAPVAELGLIMADPTGLGARYTAPSRVPAGTVYARALSTLDPSRFGSATITVVAGIEIAALAQSGAPASAGVPSANVGQPLPIGIPAPVLAQTSETFAANQTVEFELLDRQPDGSCARRSVPVLATLDPGLASLTVPVPACAAPSQLVRVPGHGSLPIQVVPVITAIEYDQVTFPNTTIRGSGFACGGTTVIFITGAVAAADLISVSCDRIELKVRPSPGSEVRVRTAGGTSAGMTAP